MFPANVLLSNPLCSGGDSRHSNEEQSSSTMSEQNTEIKLFLNHHIQVSTYANPSSSNRNVLVQVLLVNWGPLEG